MKHLLSFENIIDSPRKFMGQDGQGLGIAVHPCELVPVFYSRRISPKEKDNSFGEGPFKMSVADLLPRGAQYLACGFFGTFDEPAVRDEVLDPFKPGDIVDLIKNGKAKDSTDTRNRTQAEIGIGVMDLRNNREFLFEG